MIVIVLNKKSPSPWLPVYFFSEVPKQNREFLSFFFFVVLSFFFFYKTNPHRNKQTQFTSPLGSQQHKQVYQKGVSNPTCQGNDTSDRSVPNI